MKKFIFVSFLLIFSTNTALSQSGWFWQNPQPQGNDLNYVKFLNDTTGWAVGKKGIILKTTDNGNNWLVQNTSSVTDLLMLWIVDYQKIIAIGTNGGVFRTTNSGVNWIYTQLPGVNFNLSSIYYINNTGWIAGYDHVTTNGYIYKTTNYGQNWVLNFTSPSNHRFFSIQFLNNSTGYASTGLYLYKTTNSGINWAQLGYFPVYKSYFINETQGIRIINYLEGAVYHGYIYKTTNSGTNSAVIINLVDTLLYDLYSLNDQTMYSSGQKGKVLRTTNYGDNWFSIPTGISKDLNSVFFHNLQNGISVGANGTIIHTSNSGSNWSLKTSGIPYRDLNSCTFLNESTGFVCGKNCILKTTNSGINWHLKWDSTYYNWKSISMVNGYTGWVLGNLDIVYKTTNSGDNWYFCSDAQTIAIELNSIQFISENIGFAVGKNNGPSFTYGRFEKTTNGGLNWFGYDINQSPVFYDLYFVNNNTGFIVGDKYSIYKTTNGGINFNPINNINNSNISFIKIKFVNENTGWTFSTGNNFNESKIYKTTDSGNNWQIQFVFNNVRLSSLFCYDSLNVWAGSTKGELYASSNSGANWYLQETPTTSIINSLHFVNPQTGWAIGANGTILKTTSGVLYNGIGTISSAKPQSFSLHQNYPNPFNPVTKIRFDMSKLSNAKIIIYDLFGREITTLINEQLKPGIYEVDWDGSNYASGVYFYSLVTDEFTETKRMVLIK